ncbi:bifunctional diaminohydroxyphosphoribosylaminopyrimidine deaminase/5-amino-6-(5-phosphoribosylamino)uracil reductase RibD [Polaribacter batillariae]|uniref:Riboflavin biosynthesis protein RibD n=1 Tax=Polaribacter batillariae TaxID=2808900 RepID=A0ABX7SU21_9FLAO|nr:bifunctional diaminohydroxyphosphoribosylaminopyrimidine deaminase/5-amino-6-(5-phosphoribosylamino)uracil reductase RibD [Polaribacter batillariae]QTD37732.1 bifunctional diaminohydroxyphosphoribosylaminopyrimidine deaminase/5-amino-6-(5-phosphoribosylamino)uracil reductase RibD [Polaribacter batillariae]
MNHEFYIKRCLQIAKNGIGTSRPNPSVGAVIVHKNKIIGEGFTSVYGKNHAEVNAINAVKNPKLLEKATIYVTLEPCSHFGKTPPCADLIVKKKLKNVVIGCLDSNSLVSGKGILRLQKAGINVIVGVLEEACREHHKRFFTVQEKKRPYLILKWAETKDGFVYPKPIIRPQELVSESIKNNAPIWISNQYSQQLVHKLRSKEHAILVGTNTVLADNPQLNVRSWFGENPVRVVLDRSLRIPKNANILDGSVKTIVICNVGSLRREDRRENVCFEEINFFKNIGKQICDVLQKHNIQSLIVEGGTQTLQTFIDENLWDEAMVFVGDCNFKKGVKAPSLKTNKVSEQNIKKDVLKIYKND